MLGQLFLLVCLAAMLAVAGILLILFGPVPVRRRVSIVPRLVGAAPLPVAPIAPFAPALAPPVPVASSSLVSQLAGGRSDEFFTPPRPLQMVGDDPIPATAAQVPSLRRPKGGKVQPLPKKRSARGTESPAPFAPVVRSASRQQREEDAVTNQVPTFDTSELTIVDR